MAVLWGGGVQLFFLGRGEVSLDTSVPTAQPADNNIHHENVFFNMNALSDAVSRACRSSQLDRLRHCSTSSLESCGAVSGPIASSCPSQFASPSHAVSAGRHDHGGRVSSSVPVASSSANPRQVSTVANAISTSEADQGFTRVPVSNQVCNSAVERA